LPRNVVFLIRGKLGDSLVFQAVVREYALRHPGERITLLMRADYAALLAGERGFGVVGFGSRMALAAAVLRLRLGCALRGGRIDVFAVLWGFGDAVTMAGRLSGAARRLYIDGRMPALFPEFPPAQDADTLEGPAWLVARLLDDGLPRPASALLPQLAAMRRPGGNAVAVVPLANESRKNMDRACLDALLAEVRRRHPGAAIRLFVNPGDSGAPAVSRDLPAGVELVSFRNVTQLVGLYRDVVAWYGTDTGTYHVAAAMGIPATVFFGPTQPLKIMLPAQPAARSVRLSVLGNDHCEVKDCADPACLQQAVSAWSGKALATPLARAPASCPLRAHDAARLADVAERPASDSASVRDQVRDPVRGTGGRAPA
jgi:ADP-heptose:LPS heptosyltransferase